MKTFLLIIGCVAGTIQSNAGDLFGLKPTLLQTDGTFFPAGKITSDYKKEWDTARPDRFALFEYALKSTLSTKPSANTEKTSLDIRGGMSWDFDAVPPPEQVFPGKGKASNEPTPIVNDPSFHLGSIDTELAFAFEGNEAMTTKQWAYGLRFNYTPSLNHLEDQWYVPFIWIDYRRISEVSTELTSQIGTPAQDYWRFGSEIYWQIPLSAFAGDGSVLKAIKVIPGLQYYHSTDRKISVGFNDSHYYSIAVDYAVPSKFAWSRVISGVRLQVANGRIPPALKNQTTVSLAVTVHWEKIIVND